MLPLPKSKKKRIPKKKVSGTKKAGLGFASFFRQASLKPPLPIPIEPLKPGGLQPFDPLLNPFGYQIPFEEEKPDWQLIDPFILEPFTETGQGYVKPQHPDIPEIFEIPPEEVTEEPFDEFVPEPPIPGQPSTAPLPDPVPPITQPDIPPFDWPGLDIPVPFPPDEPITTDVPAPPGGSDDEKTDCIKYWMDAGLDRETAEELCIATRNEGARLNIHGKR